jgi:hypothetical protein
MIALAYQAKPDLGRAQARLQLLQDKDLVTALSEQASQILVADPQSVEGKALSNLSTALMQQVGPEDPLVEATPANPLAGNPEDTPPVTTETHIPTSSIDANLAIRTATAEVPNPVVSQTPRPKATVRPTFSSPFVLRDQSVNCDVLASDPTLVIEVFSPDNEPIPGIPIEITWEGGQETFFTGLYPNISLGFADFTMTEVSTYNLQVGNGGDIVRNLVPHRCSLTPSTSNLSTEVWGKTILRFSP